MWIDAVFIEGTVGDLDFGKDAFSTAGTGLEVASFFPDTFDFTQKTEMLNFATLDP